LTLAYEGTAYGGWQRQPNRATIQQLVEEAVAKLDGKRVAVHGSGRTDAGVHARAQVASFASTIDHSPSTIRRALNANLPDDIRVLRVQKVGAEFHARFSAKWKEYRYQLDAGPVADPFLRAYAWHHPRPLDLPAMRRAGRCLMGRQDFTALSAKSDRNPVRTIKRLTIRKAGNIVTIAIVADGFLYKMARTIVGALVKVGEGKAATKPEVAPAKGLTLWRVWY
jgi:tRNA pseudouridine38-40 synthase